jgi:hypothetical protein
MKTLKETSRHCPACGSTAENVEESSSPEPLSTTPRWVFVGKHIQASLVMSFLQSQGIPCWLEDEGSRYIFGEFQVGPAITNFAMTKVVVSPENYMTAQKLLEDSGTVPEQPSEASKTFIRGYLLLIHLSSFFMMLMWVFNH